jgi:hypothetical protein
VKAQKKEKTKDAPLEWSLSKWPIAIDTLNLAPIVKPGVVIETVTPGPIHYVECDSAGIRMLKKCPECPPSTTRTIHDTIYKQKIIRQNDPREVEQYKSKYEKLLKNTEADRVQLAKVTKQSESRLYWLIGLGLACLLLLIIILLAITGKLNGK